MTMITRVLNPDIDDNALNYAANLLKNDEVVGIPTETVYGLAGNALSEKSVKKIFEAKGRPQDNPLIVHISDFDMLEKVVADIPKTALLLLEKFSPGPLTMILPKRDIIPAITNCGLDTVAVRIPDNKITLSLIKKCGFPLAAPSANASGSPSPTSAVHVLTDLGGKIPLILDGGECKLGLESTVITFRGEKVIILRPGAVTAEMLGEYTETILDNAVLNELKAGEIPLSPGTKHKHYSPKAEVVLIKAANDKDFNEYIDKVKSENTIKQVAIIINNENPPPIDFFIMGDEASEQAKRLFSLLRKADEMQFDRVYVRSPKAEGIGLAVYNRLLRAAEFKVTELSDNINENTKQEGI